MTETRLVHTGDIHFGALDAGALSVLTDFITTQNIDGVVIAGDITQRGSHREFAAFRNWVTELKTPVACVPGNHDVPMLDIARRATRPFRRYQKYTDLIPSAAIFPGLSLAGLNTARGWQMRLNWAEGAIRRQDLHARLGNLPTDGRIGALFCHHPFVSPPKAPLNIRTRRGVWADKTVQLSRASLVLAGHVHTPTAIWRGGRDAGYLAVTAGTLSTRLRTAPPSFNLLTLSDDALRIDVIDASRRDVLPAPLGQWRRSGGTIIPDAEIKRATPEGSKEPKEPSNVV